MMFAKGESRAFELDKADLWNLLVTAGLSAVVVFVGNLSELLPSLDTDNGAISLILTGIIGPALVTFKDWLTDYAERY
ncbi:hypothetical protein [Rubinisphaera italica]|uniref:Uncharacterized protein n=1 Tax=Rubinisphaera italica TaxID=2527969 RepID=A0A5C5XPE2_9PLAN|nr:hypothetical protein [Rubinisphaera italica]TWT63925.1 hypothetical protein Pan54_46840 [Rubinisphaera italica]